MAAMARIPTSSGCRLIEISENLHRAELTALERDKLVAEWVELTGEVLVQDEPKPQTAGAGRGNFNVEREHGQFINGIMGLAEEILTTQTTQDT